MLRNVKNAEANGEMVVISANDPLNLVGILTPGERVAALPGNRLIIRDGVPLCSLEGNDLVVRANGDGAVPAEAGVLLRKSSAKMEAAGRPQS